MQRLSQFGNVPVARPAIQEMTDAQSWPAGLASGAVVSVTLQPFDVVRTRMQGDAANAIMQSSWRTLRTVVAESGPRSGLFRTLKITHLEHFTSAVNAAICPL